MSGEKQERRSGGFLALAIAPPLLLLLFYLGGYVWLRGTHRLVHQFYGTIVSSTSASWETVYAPAIAVESQLRTWLDPSWNPPVVLPTSMMMDGS